MLISYNIVLIHSAHKHRSLYLFTTAVTTFTINL